MVDLRRTAEEWSVLSRQVPRLWSQALLRVVFVMGGRPLVEGASSCN
jgi:hypothetical protein